MPPLSTSDTSKPRLTRDEFRRASASAAVAMKRTVWIHVAVLLPVWVMSLVLKADRPGHRFLPPRVGLLLWLGILAAVVGSLLLLRWHARRLRVRHGLVCPECGFDLSGDASKVVLTTGCCGKCRAPVITPDRGDAHVRERDLPTYAEVVARGSALVRESKRGQYACFAGMAAAFLVLYLVGELPKSTRTPLVEWGGIALFLASMGLLMLWQELRSRGRPARFGILCPHCAHSLLDSAEALDRTGKCGYCGLLAVRDLPSGAARPVDRVA
jgi:hypothetical protein